LSDDRFNEGMAVRRSVLGDAHVDRAESGKTPFDEDFQRYITENAWGWVWTRPGLDKPTRSLLTLALLAAHGHWEEFAMHILATKNTGATPEDIKEMLFHVAVYAGVPAANRGYAIATQTYKEMEEQDAEGGKK
jgi:4-carboxymuconolactone decarboxylase